MTRAIRLMIAASIMACLHLGDALAQNAVPVRIGVLGDLSGPGAAFSGSGAVASARLAAADFGGMVLGRTIEILSADHQNKPDLASQIARKWFDVDGVSAVADLPNSGVALAVIDVAEADKRTVLVSAASAADITSRSCSRYVSHWTDDTTTLSRAVSRLGVERIGKKWFFVVLDLTFGDIIVRDTSALIKALGGTVVGVVKHPFGTADFSSFLLQAIGSNADVVALGNVGADLVNSVKQAEEFGIRQSGKKLISFFTTVADVDAIGLQSAQGLFTVENFYWDQNGATRAFSKRFFDVTGKEPTKQQASVYASVHHFLAAVQAAGTDNADAVSFKMHTMPADFFGQQATVRGDGRVLLDVNLYQVKTPAESKGRWDIYNWVATLPASQAYGDISPQCAQATK